MDSIILKQRIEKWNEACRFLKSRQPDLSTEEWTAIEILADFWRGDTFNQDTIKECSDLINVLVNSDKLHANNKNIITYSKDFRGIAKTVYMKDQETFFEFKKGIEEFVRSNNSRRTNAPTVTPNPSSTQRQRETPIGRNAPHPVPPVSTLMNNSKPRKQGYIWGALVVVLILGYCGYQFWYQPEKDKPIVAAATTAGTITAGTTTVPATTVSATTTVPATTVSATTTKRVSDIPITVQQLTFANFDHEGNALSEYGSKLYANSLQYLKGVLYYSSAQPNTSIVLYVKIYRPNGELIAASKSPAGYTIGQKFTTPDQSTQSASFVLPGWGNKKCTVYGSGKYIYEVWHNNQKICQKQITIY